ncbi:17170_t:CDS:2 [Funneliformis geosporum]|uniref:17170_t:CDS:1 n=1 Tax=Funneliformis geosporum TaxID=1117311 RepID=A0A9W4SQ15_9GLOM|nr:17170_t:CDS:2 [Funneliformis geosporum]
MNPAAMRWEIWTQDVKKPLKLVERSPSDRRPRSQQTAQTAQQTPQQSSQQINNNANNVGSFTPNEPRLLHRSSKMEITFILNDV